MKNKVFWKNPNYKKRPSLKEKLKCNYLIVGGGVLGVSTAYFLHKNGAKNIVLIEKKTIGEGATGKAAGMITMRGELDIRDIISHHGKQRGLIFWESNRKGMEMMEEIIKKEKIDCDLEIQDTLYAGLPGENHKFILEEYVIEDEIEKETELSSKLISDKEMHSHIKTDLFKYAILSPKQGLSINPLKYTQNLSQILQKKGIRVYEDTPLIKIKSKVATTPKGEIHFENAIVAIDADMKNTLVKKRRTTLIVTKPLTKKQIIDIGMTKKKFVWTTKTSYEYFKITKENRLLVGAGDKTVSKIEKDIKPVKNHTDKIIKFLKDIFPQLKTRIDYAWSGTYGVTSNYIPVINITGPVVNVGGASSQLTCTITAKYLADKLIGKSSTLDKFFLI